MLNNAYLLAKIGADTAENERNVAEILPKIGNYPTDPSASRWLLAAFSASDGLVEVIALWDQLVVDGIQAGGAGLELAKLGKLAKI